MHPLYKKFYMDIREIFKEKRPKAYRSPLPLKNQRVTMKASPRGKVKVYTEEEIFLHKCRKYGGYVST